MGPEFYREDVTEKRWQLLQQLHRQYDFVLIGGWAVWAYTHQDKSRDIDIVVDYDTLGVLRQAFPNLHKNHRLNTRFRKACSMSMCMCRIIPRP